MQVGNSFTRFADNNGDPLEAGFIYFGTVNLNPETNPISVFWDAALTQPAAQPLRTIGGFISRDGTPANIYVGSTYSITVKDKKGSLIYSLGDSSSFDSNSVFPLSIANGGTGATTAATARAALGLGSAAVLTAGTGANNAVQLDAAAKLPAVDGSQLTGLSSGGFSNVAYNGSIVIDQVGGQGALAVNIPTALSYGAVDGWKTNSAGAILSGRQITLSNNKKRFQITGAIGHTVFTAEHRMPSENTVQLAGQNAIAQIKLSSSSLTSVNWTLSYATVKDNFAAETTIASGTFNITSMESVYNTGAVAIPAAAITGLVFRISTGALVAAQTLTIGDFDLRQGSTLATFQPYPFEQELLRCQRFFEKSYDIDTPPATATISSVTRFSYGAAASGVFGTAEFKVEKINNPTVSTYDEAGNAGRCSFYNAASFALTHNLNALASNWGGKKRWGFSASTATAGAAGTYTIHWTADARL